MNIKLIIYLLVIPIVIYSISSINIEQIFKKGSVNQIKTFYLFISLGISYLVSNFIFDFYQITSTISWKDSIWF